MKLKYITDDVCKSCGAKIVAETQGELDESGTPYETRTFECGHVLSYSTSSRYQVITVTCPNSKIIIARDELRKEAKDAITKFIGDLKVDYQWKNQILNHVRYS